MKRSTQASVVGGLCALFLLLNVWQMFKQQAKRVEVEILRAERMPLQVRAAGFLEAKASITLRSTFEGKVIRKLFKEGDRVQARQALVEISREKIQIDYQTKKDARLNAESELSRAQKDLRLQKTLYKKQAVAYSAVEDAQRALARAEQALRAAKEAFRLETDRWNSNILYAPFAGTIVRDGLGDEPQILAGRDLVMVADVSAFTVRVQADELDIKQVQLGQTAEVRLSLYPQTVFKAKVIQIGTSPDAPGPGIPEIPVVLALENTQKLLLRPRLSAEARIRVGTTELVLSVPRSAIDNTQPAARVWRLSGTQRLVSVEAVLGRTNVDRVEIVRGLKTGWPIATRVDPDFAAGMRVIPKKK